MRNFFFFFSESTSERYFLPAVLNFFKTLCTYTHKQANSQKGKRGIPEYDLDENKCLFIRSMWSIKNEEGIQANCDKGYPYILGYS